MILRTRTGSFSLNPKSFNSSLNPCTVMDDSRFAILACKKKHPLEEPVQHGLNFIILQQVQEF
jgi:hypothetical protein